MFFYIYDSTFNHNGGKEWLLQKLLTFIFKMIQSLLDPRPNKEDLAWLCPVSKWKENIFINKLLPTLLPRMVQFHLNTNYLILPWKPIANCLIFVSLKSYITASSQSTSTHSIFIVPGVLQSNFDLLIMLLQIWYIHYTEYW